MVEETFIAPTPKEAFILAKEKYGEFSLLKLKRARQLLNRDGKLVAEITVEVDEDLYLKSIGVDAQEELINEMEQLKTQIDSMKSYLSGESNIVVDRVSRLFLERGIRQKWLDRIIKDIANTQIASDEKLLISYILESIDNDLKVAKEDLDSNKTLLFVGPTGVGKTTLIAKLAYRYKFMSSIDSKDIAILNLDNFKVGAYQQLESFANMLGVEHRYIKELDEFKDAINEFKDYRAIFIDTAGSSPYDSSRLIKTVEFIKSIDSKKIDTTLVLPATAKYEDMVDIYDNFSFIDIDSVIITKFDETRRVGDLIAFLCDSKVAVSYMSVGQNIPDDLEVASKEKLLERFVGELHV